MKILDAKKLEKTLRTHAERDMEEGKLAGAAMIVSQHGETVCELHLGVRSIRTGEPLAPRTMFRLASMTKPVTGAAALLGLQNGWFRLEDKVSDYLPGFADMLVGRVENGRVVADHRPASEPCIWQLLSHCSGFVAEDELGSLQEEALPASAYADNRTMVDWCMAHTFLSFDPGTRTAYHGYMAFDALACILQDKSGLPFAEFVEKNIFRPIGITDLTFAPTEEQWSRMVTMHDRTCFASMIPVDMGRATFEGFPLTYTCAGASLAGTIEDYARFAELLRGGGAYGGIRVIDSRLMELMRRPWVPDGIPGRNPENSWGLGVRVAVHNPVLPNGSFGWSGAYGTHFWVDPVNDITAVFMKNNRWYDSHGCGQTGAAFERDVMDALGD